MARLNYGIPYPLDSSYMDMEISIKADNGLGFRPFAVKNILLMLVGILSCFLILNKTFVARGTIIHKGIFVLLWIWLCCMLLISDKTKQLGLQKIGSVINYLQPDNRYVNTRMQSKAADFMSICGISNIEDNGLIRYSDGSFGLSFDIIGNGSILLFEAHKNAIIDRVDTHYRKIRPDSTYHFLTVKEPQRVELQIHALDEKKQNLTTEDADLLAMIATNRYVLSDIIGSSFKSLHQYMLLQAPNEEVLNLALNILISEVENSSLMFKHVVQLEKEDAEALFRSVYGSRKEFY